MKNEELRNIFAKIVDQSIARTEETVNSIEALKASTVQDIIELLSRES